MHRYADPKHYLERLVFRAPAAGTGSLTFRLLIKQGDTNQGAFYWPTAPSSSTPKFEPSDGRSGGDLVLAEGHVPPRGVWSYRGQPGETCAAVCASHDLACDETQLAPNAPQQRADTLLGAVENTFLCAPPLLRTCSDAAPHMSGLGDGLCFFRDDTCAAPMDTSACEAVPSSSIEDGLRLCPCVPRAGRRQLDVEGVQEGTPSHAFRTDISRDTAEPPPPDHDASGSHEAAPCADDMDAKQLPPPGHGSGGNPVRCPNFRTSSSAKAATPRQLLAEEPRTDTTESAWERLQLLSRGAAERALRLCLGLRGTQSDSLDIPLLGVAAVVVGFLALVSGRQRAGGWRPGGGGAALVLGFMASDASAHNWLRSIRSRAGNRASTMSPCRARTTFAYPNIQVNANSTVSARGSVALRTSHHPYR